MIGFHGKLPKHGDFVSRGLEPAVKQAIDAFAADLVRAELPSDGLRACLHLQDRPWLVLLLPSFDAAGRYFPFAILSPFADPSFTAAETRCLAWQALAERAVKGDMDADALLLKLQDLSEEADDLNSPVPEAVWTSETPPTPLGQALAELSSD